MGVPRRPLLPPARGPRARGPDRPPASL